MTEVYSNRRTIIEALRKLEVMIDGLVTVAAPKVDYIELAESTFRIRFLGKTVCSLYPSHVCEYYDCRACSVAAGRKP
jgi:hypothetical protein